MPIIKSAIKRVKQAQSRQKRNAITKNKYKTLVKEYLKLLSLRNFDEAKKVLPQAQKALDIAAKKNILHKNTVARKKSSLMKLFTKMEKLPLPEVKVRSKKAVSPSIAKGKMVKSPDSSKKEKSSVKKITPSKSQKK